MCGWAIVMIINIIICTISHEYISYICNHMCIRLCNKHVKLRKMSKIFIYSCQSLNKNIIKKAFRDNQISYLFNFLYCLSILRHGLSFASSTKQSSSRHICVTLQHLFVSFFYLLVPLLARNMAIK